MGHMGSVLEDGWNQGDDLGPVNGNPKHRSRERLTRPERNTSYITHSGQQQAMQLQSWLPKVTLTVKAANLPSTTRNGMVLGSDSRGLSPSGVWVCALGSIRPWWRASRGLCADPAESCSGAA